MPYLENLAADFKSWIAKLEQVDKDAICRAANNVKLQAILLYGRNRMTKVVFEEKYYPAVKEMVYRTRFGQRI